jgi:hypothetical protein
VQRPATQDSPELQHEQPHSTVSESQMSGTQLPLLQVSAQPQLGEQVLVGHFPAVHLPPPVQPQVPPQPSPAPQVPSAGQLGLQQLPP